MDSLRPEREVRSEIGHESGKKKEAVRRICEQAPLAETHAHLNGAVEVDFLWQHVLQYEQESLAKIQAHIIDDLQKTRNEFLKEKLRKKFSLERVEQLPISLIFLKASRVKQLLESYASSADYPDLKTWIGSLTLVSKKIQDPSLETLLSSYFNYHEYFVTLMQFGAEDQGGWEQFQTQHHWFGTFSDTGKDYQKILDFEREKADYILSNAQTVGIRHYEMRLGVEEIRMDTDPDQRISTDEAFRRTISRICNVIKVYSKEKHTALSGGIILSFKRRIRYPQAEQQNQYAREMMRLNQRVVEWITAQFADEPDDAPLSLRDTAGTEHPLGISKRELQRFFLGFDIAPGKKTPLRPRTSNRS